MKVIIKSLMNSKVSISLLILPTVLFFLITTLRDQVILVRLKSLLNPLVVTSILKLLPYSALKMALIFLLSSLSRTARFSLTSPSAWRLLVILRLSPSLLTHSLELLVSILRRKFSLLSRSLKILLMTISSVIVPSMIRSTKRILIFNYDYNF